MNKLPQEIQDHIFLLTDDFKTAVINKNDYIAHKLYDKTKIDKTNLEIVKWVCNNYKTDLPKNIMDWAAENGHLNVVEWLHNNRTEGQVIKK